MRLRAGLIKIAVMVGLMVNSGSLQANGLWPEELGELDGTYQALLLSLRQAFTRVEITNISRVVNHNPLVMEYRGSSKSNSAWTRASVHRHILPDEIQEIVRFQSSFGRIQDLTLVRKGANLNSTPDSDLVLLKLPAIGTAQTYLLNFPGINLRVQSYRTPTMKRIEIDFVGIQWRFIEVGADKHLGRTYSGQYQSEKWAIGIDALLSGVNWENSYWIMSPANKISPVDFFSVYNKAYLSPAAGIASQGLAVLSSNLGYP